MRPMVSSSRSGVQAVELFGVLAQELDDPDRGDEPQGAEDDLLHVRFLLCLLRHNDSAT